MDFTFHPSLTGYRVSEMSALVDSNPLYGGFDYMRAELLDTSWLVECNFKFSKTQYDEFAAWYDEYLLQNPFLPFNALLLIDPDNVRYPLRRYKAHIIPDSVKLTAINAGIRYVSLSMEAWEADVADYLVCDVAYPYMYMEEFSVTSDIENIEIIDYTIVEYINAVDESFLVQSNIRNIEITDFSIVEYTDAVDEAFSVSSNIIAIEISDITPPTQVVYNDAADEAFSVGSDIESIDIVDYTVTTYGNYVDEAFSVSSDIVSIEITGV